MIAFLSGAIMTGAAAIGLLFLRSWTRTGDRLFVLFALAFWLLAIERWLLLIVSAEANTRSWVYLARLVAFVLILVAIVDKNRRRPPR
jgi:hypothetical protein